jgi:hypothetical protein
MFPVTPAYRVKLLCSAFCSFWSNTWSVDVGNSLVIAVCQGHEFNAFRGLEVRQVNDRTDFGVSQVDFDEFRQVFRQAGATWDTSRRPSVFAHPAVTVFGPTFQMVKLTFRLSH